MLIRVQDYQGRVYEITSHNPDLLGQWLVETFGNLKPDRVAPAMV